ncbi:MAG TPA: 23S rRNA (guanosine(2251)-2'-O)-methyltransferase RlmB [Clostridiales bacterium UBA8153]|nr:23S rRNA (guanosine(2251)-2'-O)-methyltransferase RlmB [Clostridiales bacterium UBA8153]
MRERKSCDIVAGKNAVREALRAGLPIREVLFAQSLPGDIAELVREIGAPTRQVQRAELDRHAQRHQNVMAVVASTFQWAEVSGMLEGAAAKTRLPLLVLLDGIQDPRNLGAAIRVADAAGADGVIIPRHRAAPPTEAVARSSAGATAHVPLARVTNLVRCMEELKAAGVWLAGLEAGAGPSLWDAALTGPLGLVVGGEGRGLRRLVRERCDHLVSIPMHGVVGSLNAATALAVVLYEVRRRRREAAPG